MRSHQEEPKERPILHVLVVGFHHKKGCQVEYSYPAVCGGSDGSDCPPGWKYLPTLALPDGSHNYDKDTVFFNLPSLSERDKTVYGISCFRQIPVEKLKKRTEDITRSTVQKAVCVLSRVPLYGHIQVKTELITHAYFEEGDFSKVSLLEDTFHNLNDCIEQIDDLRNASQLYVGLSARELVLRLRHKALLLFKLLLLEKRVLFFYSPVEPLCTTILSLLSLHPGMIYSGLTQSASFRPSRPMSPVPQYCEGMCLGKDVNTNGESPPESLLADEKGKECGELTREDSGLGKTPSDDNGCAERGQEEPRWEGVREGEEAWGSTLSRDPSAADLAPNSTAQLPPDYLHHLNQLSQMDPTLYGAPLHIFTDGYFCLPYLSLPYMDVLTDPNVRGYVLGATNVLFKQKKNISDVTIELEGCRVECADIELKRALHLTTEDLRFADHLVRGVGGRSADAFLDGVGWEGGDDWLRAQFSAYTLALLRTSLMPEGSKEVDQFNKWFVSAWQSTQSYQEWVRSEAAIVTLEDITPGHPFAGQLSVADMKLRLAHTMQTTEGGRKLNQAMASTGRVVATTSRAVGGALSQAKGALSSWWNNLTVPPSPSPPSQVECAVEAVESSPALLQVSH